MAKVLVPKFYEIEAVTVYEVSEVRYGKRAKIYSGVMFLIGKTLLRWVQGSILEL